MSGLEKVPAYPLLQILTDASIKNPFFEELFHR